MRRVLILLILCLLIGAAEFSLRLAKPDADDRLTDILRILQQDSILFWRLKSNLDTKFQGVNISTNSRGFRYREFPLEKPENTFRIICLGASPTFGWAVPFDQTYPRLLENRLSKAFPTVHFEVINVGVPGYTSFQGLKLLKREILQYSPDLITISYGINDLDRYRFYRSDGKSDRELVPANIAIIILQNVFAKSRLYSLLNKKILHFRTRLLYRFFGKVNYTKLGKVRVSLENYRNNLEDMIEEARYRGIKVLLLKMPTGLPTLPISPDPLKSSSDRYISFGIAHMESRLYDDAIADFNKALSLNPHSIKAHFCLGRCYDAKKEYNKARLMYEKAKRFDLLFRYKVDIATYNKAMEEIARQRDVPLADIVTAFTDKGGSQLFIDPIHPSPAGHSVITEEIYKILSFQNIITPFDKLKGARQRVGQLNVLLISIDALRPDHMSCYGYERQTTPNIDNFAKEGVLFSQAIAQSTWTLPSLASIMSSTYPCTHRAIEFEKPIDSSVFLLAEILKTERYHTGFFSNEGLFDMMLGLQRGFDEFCDIGGKKADGIIQRSMKWLEINQDKPFFLWLHIFDTHGPYRPPPPYNKMYLFNKPDIGYKLVPLLKYDQFSLGGIPRYVVEKGIKDADYYIAQYDGEISFVDNNIGALLVGLKRLNLYRNTLIIITADHGENLGEHDRYFSHYDVPYEALIKVPLIIKGDIIIPARKVIPTQVQSIDIMPTILDILRIERPEGIEGTSLLPLIWSGWYPSLYAFSSFADSAATSIRTEDWKLIHLEYSEFSGYLRRNIDYLENNNREGLFIQLDRYWEEGRFPEYQLYNLKNDPDELVNLVDENKQKFKFLRQRLDIWEGNQTVSETSNMFKKLDKKTKERLRSLGYCQ
jgi:arylsulfatase A-like enzyme/lysophospholipase L1-like esterase